MALASGVGERLGVPYTYILYGNKQARRVDQALSKAPAPLALFTGFVPVAPTNVLDLFALLGLAGNKRG